MGTPRNGPSGRSPCASARALSKRRITTALIAPSVRSMRSMAPSTSSRGLTAPARTSSAWPTASAHSMSSPTLASLREARPPKTVYDRGVATEDLDLYVDADDESFETMTALAIAHGWGDGLP